MALLKNFTSTGLSFDDWIKTLSTDRQAAYNEAVISNAGIGASFIESGNLKRSNIGTVFLDEDTYNAYNSITRDPTWLAFWYEWESVYGKPTFTSQTVLLQDSTVDKWIPNVESGIGNVKVSVNVTVITTTDGTVLGQCA